MTQKQKAWEKFKLQWMIDHGYTLVDLINELEMVREESDEDATLDEIFDQWEFGFGFGSEIWPCYDEFIECEYQEMKL